MEQARKSLLITQSSTGSSGASMMVQSRGTSSIPNNINGIINLNNSSDSRSFSKYGNKYGQHRVIFFSIFGI